MVRARPGHGGETCRDEAAADGGDGVEKVCTATTSLSSSSEHLISHSILLVYLRDNVPLFFGPTLTKHHQTVPSFPNENNRLQVAVETDFPTAADLNLDTLTWPSQNLSV